MLMFALAVLALASLADVVTTRLALSTGRCVELNPLMRAAVRTTLSAVIVKAIGVVVASWSLAIVAESQPGIALAAAWFFALAMTHLALRNYRIYRIAKDPFAPSNL